MKKIFILIILLLCLFLCSCSKKYKGTYYVKVDDNTYLNVTDLYVDNHKISFYISGYYIEIINPQNVVIERVD